MTQSTTTTIRTENYKTHLNRAGEGNEETILFLHGSGPGVNAWSNWQFAVPALAESYHCLAPDLVGFGESEHPENPPTDMTTWTQMWIEQSTALLDNLELDKVHLVGNSMGGALALHLMHRYPERVGRVVLMGPIGPPHEISRQIDDIWGFYEDPTPDHMAEIINWFAYDPHAAVGGDLKSIAEARTRSALQPEVRRSFEAMFTPPRQRHLDAFELSEAAYQNLEHSTLLIHGRDDHIVPLETSLYLLEHLSHVQLHVFGRCSHWTMIEYRESFNRLLRQFFDREL